MDHQSVTFGVWLGIAVLALVVANVKIWQRRRALNRVVQQDRVGQQDRVVQQDRSGSRTVPSSLTGRRPPTPSPSSPARSWPGDAVAHPDAILTLADQDTILSQALPVGQRHRTRGVPVPTQVEV